MSTPQLTNTHADHDNEEKSRRKKDKSKKRKHRVEDELAVTPMNVDAPTQGKKRHRKSDLAPAEVQDDSTEPERKRRNKKKKRAASDDEDDVDHSLPPPPAPAASTTGGVDILKLMQNVKVSSANFNDLLKSVGVPISAAAHLQSAAATIESERQLARSQAPKEKSKSKKNAVKPVAKEKKKVQGARIGDRSWSQMPGSEIERDENTEAHVKALTTKWHSPKELQRMVDEEGLLWKRGKFSAAEGVLVKTAIDYFCSQNNIDDEARQQLITEKGKKSAEAESFWTEITTAVPQRSLAQVYHFVKRAHHPLSRQGTWTREEDVALLAGVGDHGQAWEKISETVGRTSSDCRDRYRNHLVHSEKQTGKWTTEEEAKLSKLVKKLRSKSDEGEVFWTEVSNEMKTRTRQQCRDKWVDELAIREKNNGEVPRWTAKRRKKLVRRVAALGVDDPALIDWSAINAQLGDLWSASLCQRQWRILRRTVDPKLEHSHEEVVVLLQENLGNIADSDEEEGSKPKKGRKEAKRDKPSRREVVDSDEENSVDESL